MTMLHPDVPEELRGTYAGIASRARHRAPALARRHRHRADAGASLSRRPPSDRQGAAQLLGLQHARVLRARAHLCRELRPSPATWSANSSRWSRICTTRASRSSSTWSTTTPPRATTPGPTLSFRGIDNLAYYRTVPDDPRYYMDFTGCGNTLNMVHPHSIQLLMDSLRYWVTEMHVDGFRFDLASALARELKDVDQLGAFFDTIYQDPTLAPAKLIAEPWDLGRGRLPGRQLSAGLDGMERQVPRHGAQVLEGRHGPARRRSPRASPAAPICTKARGGRRRPASTSSPPTTASRCRIS